MKECPRCKKKKSLSEFHFKKTEKRPNSWCKKCVYSSQALRWKDRKRKATKLLGGKCCKCGYEKNLAALHFHHVNPKEKEFNWNKLRLKSWDKIIKELKKCILVCANCHAEIHAPEYNLEMKCFGNDNKLLNKIIKPTGFCPACKTEVFGTKYCSVKCAKLGSRKVKERPSKEELKHLTETMSWVKIGEKYGVSDNAVRKWARKYELI